jgi:hypothetical protein
MCSSFAILEREQFVEKLFVVGGRPKKDAHGRDIYGHQQGMIVKLDPSSRMVARCVEYESPPEARSSSDSPVLFTAGTVHGDTFYACTQTEVLLYQLPGFERVGYLSLPSFNDVHHVRPTPEGTLLVVSTGLDMVIEVTREGEVRREWSVLGEDQWARFDKRVDYRRVASTKPHMSHPNYVFEARGEIWVTRFEQRDAVCLTHPGRRIDIGVERPHDGIVHGRHVYFTTVDGHVVIANLETYEVERIVDLKELSDPKCLLGWCRGLLVLDEERMVIGFSRLRPTKFRDKTAWATRLMQKRKLAPSLPTRVAMYDLRRGTLCWEKNLEEEGLGTVFSIHRAEIE